MNTVVEWLEASAQRTPDALAVADVDTQLSFAQLQQRAQAAGSYIAAHAQPGQPIALYLEKSTAALCGMLGAAYARCPYSVLDVRQPAARVQNILAALQPALVLTDGAFAQDAAAMVDAFNQAADHTNSAPLPLVGLDELFSTPIDNDLLAQRRATACRDDTLYINFTSGSTGMPKGVMVAHGSVIDFISEFTRVFGFTANDRIANQAPFDFDVSVKDIYGGLCVGAAVHLVPRDYFSVPVKLMDYLCERDVTVCTWAVSALCFVSTMNGLEYRTPEHIRAVIFSGEVMPPKHLAIWRAALPHALFANVYGPTEVTCNCTYWIVPDNFEGDVLPIGRPFAHAQVFLLDEADALVETPGQQAQICVTGSGLALGYVNDPERTTQAFTDNPLKPGQRMYRTGDLGYWNDQGQLVYAGRADHQIKHLGQRIELGEIEVAAQACDKVDRACCLYNEARKKLVLFYAGEASKQEVTQHLHERLPDYMVPGKVRQLDQMPLNKNGKIDRAALAELH